MMIKKRLITLFVIIMSTTFCVPIWAETRIPGKEIGVNEKQITRAESTEWRYRKYNGKWQKRLWSATYQRWLTDWIDC